MKMSYVPPFNFTEKSELVSVINGEAQTDQKYYLIPFWIRDIFRDNGLQYKDMIDLEMVSKYAVLPVKRCLETSIPNN